MPTPHRTWICDARRELDADFARSGDTHLLRLDLPQIAPVRIYLKDESIHPSGSLKHRLARSLFLYGICNGWIREGRPVIEASSGSTAISEAYFARLLRLPFIAVVPENTAARKIEAIAALGGSVRTVGGAGDLDAAARALAAETDGHFVDQFTYAERATDWRGNNNIAESLFSQLRLEPDPIPDWIVVGAGTGGTSATIGRYIRYCPEHAGRTRLCVVDPEGSAFFAAFRGGDAAVRGRSSPVVEGIGRPRVEASFMASVIDRMIEVPDAASVAGARWLARVLGRRCGPSTGTNLVGALMLATSLRAADKPGVIASLICDPGDRYEDTIYCDAWLEARGVDIAPWTLAFERFERTGRFDVSLPIADRSV